MLQGKCTTENCLLPSFDVTSFLPLFHIMKCCLDEFIQIEVLKAFQSMEMLCI